MAFFSRLAFSSLEFDTPAGPPRGVRHPPSQAHRRLGERGNVAPDPNGLCHRPHSLRSVRSACWSKVFAMCVQVGSGRCLTGDCCDSVSRGVWCSGDFDPPSMCGILYTLTPFQPPQYCRSICQSRVFLRDQDALFARSRTPDVRFLVGRRESNSSEPHGVRVEPKHLIASLLLVGKARSP